MKKENVAKTRYSDEELEEFKVIIMEKLRKARNDLKMLLKHIPTVMNTEPTTLPLRLRCSKRAIVSFLKKKTAGLLPGNKNLLIHLKMHLSGLRIKHMVFAGLPVS